MIQTKIFPYLGGSEHFLCTFANAFHCGISQVKIFLDYKDAKWTKPETDFVEDNGKVQPKDSRTAQFLSSIYDLGDASVDFPACHKVLKEINYKGWICVDLDTARKGPRASYERCGTYVVDKLERIYR